MGRQSKKFRTLVLLAAIFPALLLVGIQAKSSRAQRSRVRTIYNMDVRSLYEAPPQNVQSHLRKWLKRELDLLPFTTYVQDTAHPDICFHDTKVGEVLGDRFKEHIPDFHNTTIKAIRKLRAEGTDILRLVAGELQPRGIEVLAGIRMSDTLIKRSIPSSPSAHSLRSIIRNG